MQYTQALAIAQHTIDPLESSCTQIVVAGSLRRGKPEVGDIEIVAVPRIERVSNAAFDLFGTATEAENNLLEMRIGELVASAELELDTQLRRNGAKYKRFRAQGIAIDLFIAQEMNYGNILAIRTGNAEFSHALVTPRRQGGLMPGNLRQAEGYLWHGEERIDCPTEEAFFEALGVRWAEPRMRDAEMAERIASCRTTAK